MSAAGREGGKGDLSSQSPITGGLETVAKSSLLVYQLNGDGGKEKD